MTRPMPALDLLANLALAGAAALIVVRPRHAAKIAASPLLRGGLVKRLGAPAALTAGETARAAQTDTALCAARESKADPVNPHHRTQA